MNDVELLREIKKKNWCSNYLCKRYLIDDTSINIDFLKNLLQDKKEKLKNINNFDNLVHQIDLELMEYAKSSNKKLSFRLKDQTPIANEKIRKYNLDYEEYSELEKEDVSLLRLDNIEDLLKQLGVID